MKVYEKLKDLNLCLHGHNINILILSNMYKLSPQKYTCGKKKPVSMHYKMFPCYSQFADENAADSGQVKDIVTTHLMNLQTNLFSVS